MAANGGGGSATIPFVAAAVIVASPLAANPFGFDQYQLPKLAVLGVATIVAIAGLLAAGGIVVQRVHIALGALLVVLLLAAVTSDSIGTALAGTDGRRFGVAGWVLMAGAFVVGSAFGDPESRRRLTAVLVASSLPVSLIAIAQRIGADPFDGDGAVVRPGSTVGAAAYLGGYLAVAIVCAFAATLHRTLPRWLAVPALAASVVALVITQSRGGWLGATAGVAVLAAGAIRSDRRRPALAWLGMTAAVVAITAVATPGIVTRAASIGRVTEGTAGGRLELITMGLDAVTDRPLLGWGPDLSRPAMHAQIADGFERTYGDERIEDRAHNVIVDVAVWSGLAGLVAFAAFWFLVGRSAWRQRSDRTTTIVAAAVLAHAVHLLFNFSIPDLDPVVWLLAGTLLPVGDAIQRWRAPGFMVWTGAAVALVALAVPMADAFAVDAALDRGVDAEQRGDLATAESAYRDAFDTSGGSAQPAEVFARFALRHDAGDAAIDAARAGTDDDPSDPYLDELLARSMGAAALATGDTQLAVESEARARAILRDSPFDASVYTVLGTALAAQGSLDEAAVAYERSIELNPARSEPVRNLGLLAERRGDTATALEYFRAALDIDPSDVVARAGFDRLGGD